MQRRDARSFLEEVLAQVPDMSKDARAKLLALVDEKPGNKRAAHLAAVFAEEVDEPEHG